VSGATSSFADDNSRNVRVDFSRLSSQRFKRFFLLQAPPRAPPPTWPTFRIDARYSVTSVEKVEQGIWPGRCANVTLGWRAEIERQVGVVGHAHAHVCTLIHIYGRTSKTSAYTASRGTSQLPVLSLSLSLSLSSFSSRYTCTRGDSHGGLERAHVADRNFTRYQLLSRCPHTSLDSPPLGSVSLSRGPDSSVRSSSFLSFFGAIRQSRASSSSSSPSSRVHTSSRGRRVVCTRVRRVCVSARVRARA